MLSLRLTNNYCSTRLSNLIFFKARNLTPPLHPQISVSKIEQATYNSKNLDGQPFIFYILDITIYVNIADCEPN